MAAKDEETKETEDAKDQDQDSQLEEHKSVDSSEDLDQESSVSETENADTDNSHQLAEERKSAQENPEMGETVLKGKIVQIVASPRRQQDYVVTLKITQQKLLDIRVLNRLQKLFLKQMQALEEGTEDQVQVPREKGRRGIP